MHNTNTFTKKTLPLPALKRAGVIKKIEGRGSRMMVTQKALELIEELNS